MPPYFASNTDEVSDPVEISKIKRCGRPSDILEIVFAKKGPSSAKPMSVDELWSLAVAKGGNDPFIGSEELDSNGRWKYIFKSWVECDNEFNHIGRALIGIGIKRFDICNIIGSCSPLFHCIYFGIIFAGGIPGGCYTTNLSGSLKYISNLCETKIIFVEDMIQLNKYLNIIDELKTVKYIIVYDHDANNLNEYNNTDNGIKIINYKQFLEFDTDNTDTDKLQNELILRKKRTNPKQCAVIIYTSGTTGESKGCMLSHDNITNMLHCSGQTLELSGDRLPRKCRIISYLPLSHLAGQVISWWHPMYSRVYRNTAPTVYYCRKDWKKTMKISLMKCKPTYFISVPRMYEKMYEAIIAGLANASFLNKLVFNFILWIGTSYYHNTKVGGNGEIPLLWSFVSKKLCDDGIKKKFGFGSCVNFASGGAPLADEIRETFAALNMPIADGYGLSEVGVIAFSRPNHYVPNACGPVMMGSEILIDHVDGRDKSNHGEICCRGRHVMMGYINELDKTNASFDDSGWFHSGDIGYIDKYNCLHITGRIKELIITAGGENIAPVPIENYIQKLCPALSQVIMIGDKKKYCSIIVCIACKVDENGNITSELESHAKLINNNVDTVDKAINDEIWHKYLRDGIQKYNNDNTICVSNACRIQYFQILHNNLSVKDGTLSSSLKVKRNKLYNIYKKQIDALYGDYPQFAVHSRK